MVQKWSKSGCNIVLNGVNVTKRIQLRLSSTPYDVTRIANENGTVLVQNETFSVRDLKYLEKNFQIFKGL